MVMRDFYVILGVPPTESPGGIKAAYRALAKRLHPDRMGEGGSDRFREVQEAYDVLSDPERRRDYNRELDLSREGERWPIRVAHEPPRSPVMEIAPRWMHGHPEKVHPSLPALLDRLRRNFFSLSATKSEREEGLTLEVVLTPEEAATGVLLPVGVPVFIACPRCRGEGYTWGYPCPSCNQEGVVETESIVRIDIPPMVRPHTIMELPLGRLGIANLFLRLHILVDR